MATYNFGPNHFPALVSEIIGYKSGLALSFEEMRNLIKRENIGLLEKWPSNPEEPVRIRAEGLEEVIATLLYCVGAVRTANITPPGLGGWHKYINDEHLSAIERDVFNAFIAAFEADSRAREGQQDDVSRPFDATPFVVDMALKHGADGARIAEELVIEIQDSIMRSPISLFRQIEWRDVIDLKALFESESLVASHGKFIDQRYIEYLGQQFGDIGQMNWRKFEGLTGEFFDRLGFIVDMGPGRNDDGVDIRVWSTNKDDEAPALLLVQCKRQKATVSKTVVKALWADVVTEGASSGLIVTSSSFSPGARKVCTARSYPVHEANRTTLRKWILSMRQPRSGVFLGE